MKKLLIPLIIFFSFIGVKSVSALSYVYENAPSLTEPTLRYNGSTFQVGFSDYVESLPSGITSALTEHNPYCGSLGFYEYNNDYYCMFYVSPGLRTTTYINRVTPEYVTLPTRNINKLLTPFWNAGTDAKNYLSHFNEIHFSVNPDNLTDSLIVPNSNTEVSFEVILEIDEEVAGSINQNTFYPKAEISYSYETSDSWQWKTITCESNTLTSTTVGGATTPTWEFKSVCSGYITLPANRALRSAEYDLWIYGDSSHTTASYLTDLSGSDLIIRRVTLTTDNNYLLSDISANKFHAGFGENLDWDTPIEDDSCQGVDFGNGLCLDWSGLTGVFNFGSPNNFVGSFFNSVADNSYTTCQRLPSLASWLNMDSAYICPWFDSDIMNQITPVFTALVTMIIFVFVIKWLSKEGV